VTTELNDEAFLALKAMERRVSSPVRVGLSSAPSLFNKQLVWTGEKN